MCIRVTRIEIDRFSETSFAALPVEISPELHRRKRCMRFGKLVVEAQCLKSSRSCAEEYSSRRLRGVATEQVVRVRQSRVSQRERRVQRDRLLEEFYAFPYSFLAPHVPMIASFEIELVCLFVSRRPKTKRHTSSISRDAIIG